MGNKDDYGLSYETLQIAKKNLAGCNDEIMHFSQVDIEEAQTELEAKIKEIDDNAAKEMQKIADMKEMFIRLTNPIYVNNIFTP